MSPSFTAKRPGVAKRCGHSFEAGDEVFYDYGVPGWFCYECAARSGLLPRQPLANEPPPNEPIDSTLRLALALEALASSIRASAQPVARANEQPGQPEARSKGADR